MLGPHVDNSNNNLFEFGYVGDEARGLPTACLMLCRLDYYLPMTIDADRLRSESRPRTARMKDDPEFIERERKHMANVQQFKEVILNQILHWPDIECLPPVEFCERKKAQLLDAIRSTASGCFTNYGNAASVASLCYGAFLFEPDNIG